MKTYYIESLGCAKNLVDSEVFAGILERAELEPVELPEDADLVLVNTCSFLTDSLRELDLVLTDLAEIKQDIPAQKLLVTGCVMNRGLETFRELFPEVDSWLGLKDFAALENFLYLAHSDKTERAGVEATHHRYLRISDGCANNCSYCTIPSIRGTLQSVPMEDLVREAEQLALDEDYPPLELIVIAQDTANYGMDIYGRKALPELLEKLHAIPQYQWIRVLYMHPDHFDTAWLKLWNKLPKLLPYFEIPVQHSEDHILKAMNRKRMRSELLDMFATIKKELPQAVLRTTLITGFPGETRADGNALQNFVKSVQFQHLGVFVYSQEEGTPAADMANQVSEDTAERRRDRILSLQSDISTELLEKYVDQTLNVLVEGLASDDEDDVYIGRTWFQAPEIDGITFVQGTDLQAGQIYSVHITEVIDVDLFGDVVTT